MNKRELRLEKYGINKHRYKELCGFCEQYPEWKVILRDYTYIKGKEMSDLPGDPNKGMKDSVSKDAIKLAQIDSNCKLIESVAHKADKEFWEYLIKSVCYRVPVTYLITVEGMTLEKSAFYERRRYFFYLLDNEQIRKIGT